MSQKKINFKFYVTSSVKWICEKQARKRLGIMGGLKPAGIAAFPWEITYILSANITYLFACLWNLFQWNIWKYTRPTCESVWLHVLINLSFYYSSFPLDAWKLINPLFYWWTFGNCPVEAIISGNAKNVVYFFGGRCLCFSLSHILRVHICSAFVHAGKQGYQCTFSLLVSESTHCPVTPSELEFMCCF